MPFTPAHSALVLPLIRINPRYVSATGLIAGSVAPDFEYFFKMSVSGVHGHTIAGIFYFDLPVVAFLALLFHIIIKPSLVANLPYFFQRRLKAMMELDFLDYLRKNPLAFIISACIGSASHIFWDSFTHNTGYFVNELSFYDSGFIPFNGVRYPLWYALQHISTFVGLSCLTAYVVLMKPQPVELKKPSFIYWTAILVVTMIVVLIRFNFSPLAADIGNFVVSTISAMCIAFTLAGIPSRRRSANG
jgi:hypothetical protein